MRTAPQRHNSFFSKRSQPLARFPTRRVVYELFTLAYFRMYTVDLLASTEAYKADFAEHLKSYFVAQCTCRKGTTRGIEAGEYLEFT